MIENKKVMEDMVNLLDYDSVKDYLFMNVINAEENRSMLNDIPHTTIGDIAIIYRVLIKTTPEGMLSAKVTNEMMDAYGIDVSKLHNDALLSAPRLLPPSVNKIENVLNQDPSDVFSFRGDSNMFIISNEKFTDGASCIFYAGVLNDLASKLGHDLYVIPSSTDECIAVCDNPDIDYQHLQNTLQEINQFSCVGDKKLSDSLYHYDKHNHVLEKNDDYQKKIHKSKTEQLLN